MNIVVEQLKGGRYNEIEAGKHITEGELSKLKRQIAEAEKAKEEA